MKRLRWCCAKCGFPINMERDIVILDSNIFCLLNYENGKCSECGHISDGTTISSVHRKISEIVNKRIQERKQLIRFFRHYCSLTEEQKTEICTELPRFVITEGIDDDADAALEPISWRVAFQEIISDTQLGKTILDNIVFKE